MVAPHRIDAVGAACIIMAHTTAFYDLYREKHEAFFAYPDYFVFQGQETQACYGMLTSGRNTSPLPSMVTTAPVSTRLGSGSDTTEWIALHGRTASAPGGRLVSVCPTLSLPLDRR